MYPEVGSGALPLHGFDLAFGALHAEAPLVGLRVVSDTFTRKLASPLETCLGRGLRIQLGAFPISASKVSRSWPVSSQSTTSEPAAVATNGHAVQPPSVPVLRVGCRHAPAERLRHRAHFLRVDDAIQVAVAVDGDDLPRARRDGGTAEQVGHSQADRGHDVAVPAAGEAATSPPYRPSTRPRGSGCDRREPDKGSARNWRPANVRWILADAAHRARGQTDRPYRAAGESRKVRPRDEPLRGRARVEIGVKPTAVESDVRRAPTRAALSFPGEVPDWAFRLRCVPCSDGGTGTPAPD